MIKNIIGKILYHVKDYFPYRYMVNRLDSQKFIDDYTIWKNTPSEIMSTRSDFNTIVSVQGFGYSGSGAIVDLLREYDECQVFGGCDDESGVSSQDVQLEEFDFLRHSGGFYDIERHLDCNNIFVNDGVINRFIKMVYGSKFYKLIPQSHNVFNEFIYSITDLDVLSLNWRAYNGNLYPHDRTSSIFFLKNLTKKEYRNICRSCINLLLNRFKISGKTVFVADQMCNDMEFDYDRDADYFDNLKTIVVYRDPRDIYAFAKDRNVEWIPHASANDFIMWYKRIMKGYKESLNGNVMVVQFERLITEYDIVVANVEKFLDIHNHKNKFRNLKPDISARNIGMWRTSNYPREDFCHIEEALPLLCFHKI